MLYNTIHSVGKPLVVFLYDKTSISHPIYIYIIHVTYLFRCVKIISLVLYTGNQRCHSLIKSQAQTSQIKQTMVKSSFICSSRNVQAGMFLINSSPLTHENKMEVICSMCVMAQTFLIFSFSIFLSLSLLPPPPPLSLSLSLPLSLSLSLSLSSSSSSSS